MSGVIEWLLDLKTLRFGQEGVQFGFERAIPGWGWALVVLGAAALAWWSYRRLEGSRTWRGVLGVLRAALLIVVVVLIAGPRLIKSNEMEERDWVLVLADRSASMTIRDAPGAGDGAAARMTREEQLRRALEASREVWESLAAERVVVWLGFDGGAYELARGSDEQGAIELGEAAGRRTAIGRALEQGLRRAAARPLAGVVLLSDGRSIDEPSRAALRRLQAEKIPVFTVPLGSDEPVRDIGIRGVEGPRVAFTNDLVPVEVELETIGDGAGEGGWGTVQLIDLGTGLVLDERDIDAAAGDAGGDGTRTITLTAKPKGPDEGGADGAARWGVRVRPAGPDLVAENNEAEFSLELESRPLRVAYFDGYPRWEGRYLKWLLLREQSIRSASLILSEGKRFVQEGEIIIGALPASPEEWKQFDVIVMGDVRPQMFTDEQLRHLREHVGAGGAGLLWIGGEAWTPGGWGNTPLADLLPMALSAGPGGMATAGTTVRAWGEPVLVRPTAAAERYGVLRLADQPESEGGGVGAWWPRALTDPQAGWSLLRWAQRIDPRTLKPTAEVLAEAVTASGSDRSPLVISMRFGAGRVLYVGTDEIWRWRYGRGEFLPERFWLQMIRLLGRESLARSGKTATLVATPRRVEVDQPVRIAVELLDQRLVDAAPTSLRVRLVRTGPAGDRTGVAADPNATPVEIVLAPEGGVLDTRAGSRIFSATWIGAESGHYRIDAVDPLLVGERLEAEVDVWLAEDELRQPQTDHAFLAELSEATGGAVVPPAQLSSLPDLLPNRRVRLLGTPEQETLWDTPLALILVMLLLTAEWIGRRIIRLV